MKRLIFLLLLVSFSACDFHYHDREDWDYGYMEVNGREYELEAAFEYYPPYEWTSDSELIRIELGDRWSTLEPGMDLLVWVPGRENGLVPGRYVWDSATSKPYGIAAGEVWSDDRRWVSEVVGGWMEVDWMGNRCEVSFNLIIYGGGRLTGRYFGDVNRIWED